VRDVPKVRGKKARAEEKRQRRLLREREEREWREREQRPFVVPDGFERVEPQEYSEVELNCKGCDGPCGRCEELRDEETVK